MKVARYRLISVDNSMLPSIVLSEDTSFEIGDTLEINDFKGTWKVIEKEIVEVSSKIYFHTLKRL